MNLKSVTVVLRINILGYSFLTDLSLSVPLNNADDEVGWLEDHGPWLGKRR